MIARLSIPRPQRSDDVAIAQRSVWLLPMRADRPSRVGSRPVRGSRKYFHAVMLLVCLALGATVFSRML
jgi:hypothetical protein